MLQLPAQEKPKLLTQGQDALPAERSQHLCPASLSIHQRQAGRAGRPSQPLRAAVPMFPKIGHERVNECWGVDTPSPKSPAGHHFPLSYEFFTAAKAPCKYAASLFPSVTLHHMLLPPVTYTLPVPPASVAPSPAFRAVTTPFPPAALRRLR